MLWTIAGILVALAIGLLTQNVMIGVVVGVILGIVIQGYTSRRRKLQQLSQGLDPKDNPGKRK